MKVINSSSFWVCFAHILFTSDSVPEEKQDLEVEGEVCYPTCFIFDYLY